MLEFEEYKFKLGELKPTLETLRGALHLDDAKKELDELRAATEVDGFWNDGAAAQRLAHPSGQVQKTYHVKVKGDGLAAKLEQLEKPMGVDGVSYRGARLQLLEQKENRALVAMTLSEGKNREIRNMCGAVGLEVLRLKRVSEGALQLGNLKSGTWRYLTAKEIGWLKQAGGDR